MACIPCFKDWISCGVDTLQVNGLLTPDSSYIWTITNKGAKYQGEVTTDVNGQFNIPVTYLPDGLLNPYAGSFVLTVVGNDAYGCNTGVWNDSAYCDEYDCIEFEVVNGTADKNTLGCACPELSDAEYRITDAGDYRTTESGDHRII